MKLIGSGGQVRRHPKFDASGVITNGTTPQLVLAQSMSRCSLFLQNISAGSLWFEIGSARAVATITSGAVTAVSVTGAGTPGYPQPNAGFGFTYPPVVEFIGGGYAGNSQYLGLGQFGAESPNSSLIAGRPAKGHAVLTGGAVSSIVIDDPGAGYVKAPFVWIYNNDLDPYGCAVPSATVGLLLTASGGSVTWNGTVCPTDAISVYGATTGQAYICKWMD